ncbi:hypothetical protein [Hyphomonas sp.]|uniref:hypothetical protein n=1 Tax=Alphaproteobacteria TaxID=28211 RepID=UPI0032632506
MERSTADLVVKPFLREARRRLTTAVKLTRKAEARAKAGETAGETEKAIRLALQVEPLLYEVTHFVNTACIVNRLWKG